MNSEEENSHPTMPVPTFQEELYTTFPMAVTSEPQVVPSDCVGRKRKFSEGSPSWTLPVHFGEASQDDAFNNVNSRTVHAAAQSAEGEEINNKKIRTDNKKELSIMRVQIAMISDRDGDKPIHIAVAQENLKLVQTLCALMLKAAISLDLTNYLRQTPLHLAVTLSNFKMVSLLLKCGAAITLRDRNGNSVVHMAVKSNTKKDVLRLILSHLESKKVLDSLDHDGYSALHYAVLKNNKTAVRCLHKVGARMDIADGKSGRTPLVRAILEQNADMVSLLLECGACPDMVDYSGRSAFEMALHSSNKLIIKLLEKRVHASDFEHPSPESSKTPVTKRTRYSEPTAIHSKRTSKDLGSS